MRWNALAIVATWAFALTASAQVYPPLVPGTGQKVVQVGDNFEDPDWHYIARPPKSSRNLDDAERLPGGESANGRWYEGVKRGHPDIVRRVPTPKGGLPGSKGALLLRSVWTGIPGAPSYRSQQDDFICDIHYQLGGAIPVWQSPNFVVRVFLPPVKHWERRSGTHFGIRMAVDTRVGYGERETYWPGMFIDFTPKQGDTPAHATLRVRANRGGGDYDRMPIRQTGWWTFGMSVTPDGRIHYYASPGVDKLTKKDRIASEFPYGYRAERFKTFFFNVVSADDGRSWSTPFVIDDCEFFYVPPRMATRPQKQPGR